MEFLPHMPKTCSYCPHLGFLFWHLGHVSFNWWSVFTESCFSFEKGSSCQNHFSSVANLQIKIASWTFSMQIFLEFFFRKGKVSCYWIIILLSREIAMKLYRFIAAFPFSQNNKLVVASKCPKYDQSCRQNLYKYTNFHGLFSFK